MGRKKKVLPKAQIEEVKMAEETNESNKLQPEEYSEDRKKAEEEKGKEIEQKANGLKIKDLVNGMKKINIVVEITEIGEKREFNKFGRKGFVADGKIKDVGDDGTETIKVTLWNEDIDRLHVGDKVRFENAYLYEYKDELVITAGKFGKIFKV